MKKMIYGLIALLLLFSACTKQDTQIIGGDTDEHGCLVAAGYSWDTDIGACVRSWELEDESVRNAAKMAVAPLSYPVTVVEVTVMRCPGCFAVKLQRNDNREMMTVNIIDWKISGDDNPAVDTSSRSFMCGDYFKHVSDNLGGGATYYIGTKKFQCPVVAPDSMSQECKEVIGLECTQLEADAMSIMMCSEAGGRPVNTVGGAACGEDEENIGKVYGFISPNICCRKISNEITDFEGCIAAGYPAMESYPRKCAVPGGKTFTEKIEDHELGCLNMGGKWIASAEECEGLSEEVCGILGGEFDPCASACRNDPEAEICTMQCVMVCSFSEDSSDESKNYCTPEQKKANICTMDYSPVCGYYDQSIQCIRAPCAETYSNACTACASGKVEYWVKGEC